MVFRDWETGAKDKHKCQVLQLAAVIIDVKRLEIIENSTFQSLIKPEEDPEKLAVSGLLPVQEDALQVNKLNMEELRKAPTPDIVWGQYIEYLSNYNRKGINGNKWDAPIISGFNNINFDDVIDRRMCSIYGPKLDNGDMTIYHPIENYDVSMLVRSIFNYHRITKTNSMGMDAIREYMGYKTDGAHNAEIDVKQGADLLIRCFRLNRNLIDGKIDLPLGKKIKFKGCVNGKI